MNGKQVRLNRILEKGKAVIVPMDHGVSSGPLAGLDDMDGLVKMVTAGGASSVVLHKGMVKQITPPTCGVIMHLSASTMLGPDPNRKSIIASVDEAILLGCDAVSIHVNVGGCDSENEMLASLGEVSDDCDAAQMPLLAMMYPRGKNVPAAYSPDAIALVARVAAELGADIVKCPYTGTVESFRNVVRGCPVPVVIAGGQCMNSDRAVLELVAGAMEAGGAGASIGRNIFQHPSPERMTAALRAVIIGGAAPGDAMRLLTGGK